MQEVIADIVEKINFKNKDLVLKMLHKCIHESSDSTKSTYAIHDNVVFKTDALFKNFEPFINEFGKDKKYEAGVEALYTISQGLGVDIEKNECFIIFHIRNLGKFRMKESKLHDELKSIWGQYKKYALKDQEFSYALKNLMRMGYIDYRKGNLHLNASVLIRYRTK